MQIEYLKVIIQGGMVSITVSVILLAMSIGSWTLMLIKAIQIRQARGKSSIFMAVLSPHVQHHNPYGNGSVSVAQSSDAICDPESIRTEITKAVSGHPKQPGNPFERLALQGLSASDQYFRYAK